MVDQADKLRNLLSQHNKSPFFPNKNILLEICEGRYAGRFSSRIRWVDGKTIGINMPVKDGIITPIAVSTNVRIVLPEKESFKAVVIDRFNHPVPSLILKVVSRETTDKRSRVIAVTSGKGGVGKTNIAVNLAIAMSTMGYKTLVFDADIGLANADLIMGVNARYCLKDFISGKKQIYEIIEKGPTGVLLISGGTGLIELADLEESKLNEIEKELYKLEEYADVVIIDTGAGISERVINFLSAAGEVVIVTTPEPTAITDAYTILKICSAKASTQKVYRLVVNRAENNTEADDIAEKMKMACHRFLNFRLEYTGFISESRLISKAVKEQIPFILHYPEAIPSRQVRQIACNLLGDEKAANQESVSGLKSFFKRFFIH